MKQLLGHYYNDESTVNLLEPHGFIPSKSGLEYFILSIYNFSLCKDSRAVGRISSLFCYSLPVDQSLCHTDVMS